MTIEPAIIQIRFADVDLMGHVNNAVYLSYFESARMHYFNQMLGRDWNWLEEGIILLKNEIEYIRPLRLNHSPVVKISVASIGNKSFTLEYRLEVDNELFCKGSSTLVGYDNTRHKSISIPEIMKEALVKLKEER